MRARALLLTAVAACATPAAAPDASPRSRDASLRPHPAPDAALARDAARPLDDATAAPPDAAPPAPDAAPAAFPPRGPVRTFSTGVCGALAPRGRPYFVAFADLTAASAVASDLLAPVNRSPVGALAAGDAPPDLVDIAHGTTATALQCASRGTCLRRDAAAALRAMTAAMSAAGHTSVVLSAYRDYFTQCSTFLMWAARGGFCDATMGSALAGHTQHQLGTTVDLFTREWAQFRPVFRRGFGCTRAGAWLAENAWRYGFVIPYPLHPDDRLASRPCVARSDLFVSINPRTGYAAEPWHLRYIGAEHAARYHADWLASGPGTPGEITLEAWLRRLAGLPGDTDLPVCDGCNCGACATLAERDGRPTPCGDRALRLDPYGRAIASPDPPRLLTARAAPSHERNDPPGLVVVEATLEVPLDTVTQPPITTARATRYLAGASFTALAPYPRTAPRAFPDLPGAWRLAVEPVPRPAHLPAFPWRASLAEPALASVWNRALVLLPAPPGRHTIRLAVVPPAGTRTLRVALLRDAAPHAATEVPVAESVIPNTRPAQSVIRNSPRRPAPRRPPPRRPPRAR